MSVKFCPSLAMCKKIMLQKKLQQLLRMSLDSQTAFQISKDVMMAPLGSDGFMDSEDFPLRKALLLGQDISLA